MIAILYIVIVLSWVVLIYIPLICFAGLVLCLVTEDATSVMHNPYFGLIKVSKNRGILVWSMRLIFLGAIFACYCEWYRNGISPFIPL